MTILINENKLILEDSKGDESDDGMESVKVPDAKNGKSTGKKKATRKKAESNSPPENDSSVPVSDTPGSKGFLGRVADTLWKGLP